jgi:uncharacterized protein YndB with AHSA1/START domain
MTPNADVETVERVIDAPAAEIFALLVDPSRHKEIDGSGTVRDPKEASQVLTLGSKFGMSMKKGLPYSMVSEVIEFEPDRRIAWQTRPSVAPLGLFIGGRIWRYELEPVDSGTTRVRESWDISQERAKLVVRAMRRQTREAMEATLARLDKLLGMR